MNIKNIIYSIIFFLVFGMMFSCAEDAEVSSIAGEPAIVFTSHSDDMTLEEGNTVTIDFVLSDEQIVATQVVLTVDEVNTTATEGSDFSFSHDAISIPAYVKEGSFDITISNDRIAEGTEKITFNIEGVNDPFSSRISEQVVVNITDSQVHFTFDWSGEVIQEDMMGMKDTFDLCSVDMDIYVLDGDGADLGRYGAATGSCPENLQVFSRWGDGSYYLSANLYDNGISAADPVIPIPIRITAEKVGVFNETFTPSEQYMSDGASDPGGSTFITVAIVTVTGGTYRVTMPDGTLVAEG